MSTTISTIIPPTTFIAVKEILREFRTTQFLLSQLIFYKYSSFIEIYLIINADLVFINTNHCFD